MTLSYARYWDDIVFPQEHFGRVKPRHPWRVGHPCHARNGGGSPRSRLLELPFALRELDHSCTSAPRNWFVGCILSPLRRPFSHARSPVTSGTRNLGADAIAFHLRPSDLAGNMSRCSYCDRELPGFEALCRECFEAGYERLVHPKPWWVRFQLRPRFTRDNFIGFFVFFVFFVATLRFDFPYFHVRHMQTTGTSALIACVAFFYEGEGRSQPDGASSGRVKQPVDWRHLALLGAGEVAVSLFLYLLFAFLPVAVEWIFALVGGVIIQYDILFPRWKRSLGSVLGAITAVPGTACMIAWMITDRDLWLRLTIVGISLSAALIVLDRWEDFE